VTLRRAPRRFAAATAFALAIVAALVWTAAPASAHATLEQTTPSAGAVLADPPRTVGLRFGESVEVAVGSVRVFDAGAHRVTTGRPHHPTGQGSSVEVNLPRTLPDGPYVVTWRVISADGHPVHGAFTFRVGAAGASGSSGADDTRSLAARLLAADQGNVTVGVVFGAVRFLLFAAMVVFVGAAVFVATLWPAGLARSRRLVVAAGVVAFVATVLAIGLQGAYAAGLGLGDALRWSTVSAVRGTRYGTASQARLVLLLAAVPVAVRPLRAMAAKAAAGVLAAVLLATIGWAGHAGSGSAVPFAMAVDVAHLGAVSVWLGGLAVIVAVLLRRGADRTVKDGAADVVARFSPVALLAVA
jgi:copper transport protein